MQTKILDPLQFDTLDDYQFWLDRHGFIPEEVTGNDDHTRQIDQEYCTATTFVAQQWIFSFAKQQDILNKLYNQYQLKKNTHTDQQRDPIDRTDIPCLLNVFIICDTLLIDKSSKNTWLRNLVSTSLTIVARQIFVIPDDEDPNQLFCLDEYSGLQITYQNIYHSNSKIDADSKLTQLSKVETKDHSYIQLSKSNKSAPIYSFKVWYSGEGSLHKVEKNSTQTINAARNFSEEQRLASRDYSLKKPLFLYPHYFGTDQKLWRKHPNLERFVIAQSDLINELLLSKYYLEAQSIVNWLSSCKFENENLNSQKILVKNFLDGIVKKFLATGDRDNPYPIPEYYVDEYYKKLIFVSENIQILESKETNLDNLTTLLKSFKKNAEYHHLIQVNTRNSSQETIELYKKTIGQTDREIKKVSLAIQDLGDSTPYLLHVLEIQLDALEKKRRQELIFNAIESVAGMLGSLVVTIATGGATAPLFLGAVVGGVGVGIKALIQDEDTKSIVESFEKISSTIISKKGDEYSQGFNKMYSDNLGKNAERKQQLEDWIAANQQKYPEIENTIRQKKEEMDNASGENQAQDRQRLDKEIKQLNLLNENINDKWPQEIETLKDDIEKSFKDNPYGKKLKESFYKGWKKNRSRMWLKRNLQDFHQGTIDGQKLANAFIALANYKNQYLPLLDELKSAAHNISIDLDQTDSSLFANSGLRNDLELEPDPIKQLSEAKAWLVRLKTNHAEIRDRIHNIYNEESARNFLRAYEQMSFEAEGGFNLMEKRFDLEIKLQVELLKCENLRQQKELAKEFEDESKAEQAQVEALGLMTLTSKIDLYRELTQLILDYENASFYRFLRKSELDIALIDIQKKAFELKNQLSDLTTSKIINRNYPMTKSMIKGEKVIYSIEKQALIDQLNNQETVELDLMSDTSFFEETRKLYFFRVEHVDIDLELSNSKSLSDKKLEIDIETHCQNLVADKVIVNPNDENSIDPISDQIPTKLRYFQSTDSTRYLSEVKVINGEITRSKRQSGKDSFRADTNWPPLYATWKIRLHPRSKELMERYKIEITTFNVVFIGNALKIPDLNIPPNHG